MLPGIRVSEPCLNESYLIEHHHWTPGSLYPRYSTPPWHSANDTSLSYTYGKPSILAPHFFGIVFRLLSASPMACTNIWTNRFGIAKPSIPLSPVDFFVMGVIEPVVLSSMASVSIFIISAAPPSPKKSSPRAPQSQNELSVLWVLPSRAGLGGYCCGGASTGAGFVLAYVTLASVAVNLLLVLRWSVFSLCFSTSPLCFLL
jgi:hypothetical protein